MRTLLIASLGVVAAAFGSGSLRGAESEEQQQVLDAGSAVAEPITQDIACSICETSLTNWIVNGVPPELSIRKACAATADPAKLEACNFVGEGRAPMLRYMVDSVGCKRADGSVEKPCQSAKAICSALTTSPVLTNAGVSKYCPAAPAYPKAYDMAAIAAAAKPAAAPPLAAPVAEAPPSIAAPPTPPRAAMPGRF